MSGLGLVLLLLKVDSIASLFAVIPLPHVEQNFATSSILEPHEAQNSYIPPIILLPLPYHMLLYFRYSKLFATGPKPKRKLFYCEENS